MTSATAVHSPAELRAFISSRAPFEVAVWDFDGVVGDTEPTQARIYREMLTEHGIEVEADFFQDLAGRTEPEIWSALKQRYGIEGDVDDLRSQRIARVIPALADEIRPNWFVRPAVTALEDIGARSLVISSGNEEVVDRYLEVWDLRHLFTGVSAVAGTSADVPKGERLQAALAGAGSALVIEDSVKYLRLAAELGAVTLGVQHSLNADLIDAADAVLQSGQEPPR